MLVLGIETASDVCAVGLVDGDRPLADLALLRPREHGSKLALLVEAALAASGVGASDLDAVAVSSGPGSYTGLRIGVSTAKGLCAATGASLVGVPTMLALATTLPAGPQRTSLLVGLPSRRGEVYAALYESVEQGWQERMPPTAVDLADLAAWLPSSDGLDLTGPAAPHVRAALDDEEAPRPVRVVQSQPSGLAVARLGLSRLRGGATDDVASFEPTYLKPFVSGGA